MIRAVLFDALGTLVARAPGTSGAEAHENAMRRALAGVDPLVRMPPYDEFQRAYEATPDPAGVFNLEAKLRDVFAALALKPRAQRQLAARVAPRYWQEQGALLRRLPDVAPCLAALPGEVQLGLVTNWPDGPSLRHALDRLGLLGRFDVLAVSGEVGVEKPDPRLFREALDGVDAEPGEVLMVGDNLADDLVPAKALGMRTALVMHPRPEGGKVDPLPGIDLALGTLEDLPASLAAFKESA